MNGIPSSGCQHLLEDTIHLVDSFTMPVCKYARASGSRCFKGEAGFSYCAAKDEKYYGFEGDVLPEMAAGLHVLLIEDKGYIRPSLKQELEQHGIDL
jgi:hypothetical protein